MTTVPSVNVVAFRLCIIEAWPGILGDLGIFEPTTFLM